MAFLRRSPSTDTTNGRIKTGGDSEDSKCAVKSIHSPIQREAGFAKTAELDIPTVGLREKGAPDVRFYCQPDNRGQRCVNSSNGEPLGERVAVQAGSITPHPTTVEGACGPIDNSPSLTVASAAVAVAMVPKKALVPAARPRASDEATIAPSMTAEGRAKGIKPRDLKKGCRSQAYGGRHQKRRPPSRALQPLEIIPAMIPHTGGVLTGGRRLRIRAVGREKCRNRGPLQEGRRRKRRKFEPTAAWGRGKKWSI